MAPPTTHADRLRAMHSREEKVAYAKLNANSLKLTIQSDRQAGRYRCRITDARGAELDQFDCSSENASRIFGLPSSNLQPPRRWRFYETASGSRPVLDYIMAMTEEDRTKVRAAMAEIKTKGMQVSKLLTRGIHQIAVETKTKSYRLFFSPQGKRGNVLLALHMYDKATQNTPREVIFLAADRLADWRRRGGHER